MSRMKFNNDIVNNAMILNIKGVELIDVERPPVKAFEKVIPKLKGTIVKRVDVEFKDYLKLSTVISMNWMKIRGYNGGQKTQKIKNNISDMGAFHDDILLNDPTYNRESIEDLASFIIDYDIQDICTITNLDKCIKSTKTALELMNLNTQSSDTWENIIDIFECFKEYIQIKESGRLDPYL